MKNNIYSNALNYINIIQKECYTALLKKNFEAFQNSYYWLRQNANNGKNIYGADNATINEDLAQSAEKIFCVALDM